MTGPLQRWVMPGYVRIAFMNRGARCGRGGWPLIATLLAVVGCSSDTAEESSVPASSVGTTSTATDELCASLVPGQYGFFQSLPTIVGEIRTVEGGPGPGSRLWPDALAGHADGDAAAWCQGKDAGNGYVFYVATFDGTMELLGRAHLWTHRTLAHSSSSDPLDRVARLAPATDDSDGRQKPVAERASMLR